MRGLLTRMWWEPSVRLTVCLTILMFMNLLEILVPLVKNNKKESELHTYFAYYRKNYKVL